MYEMWFQIVSSPFPLGSVADVSMFFFSRILSGILGACRRADLTSWELVDFLTFFVSDSQQRGSAVVQNMSVHAMPHVYGTR